ncbi:hypothetical protein [Haloactinomyces albus]|uniref:Uncharacterized protein n=1 Tax=Haloactinomyces albus TaxID=1352928 RepID=A0AAE4CK36_9ACTN|nr:hypothetical protein [Haloactinomyces albus]MDR7299891.1 hypothetical protein [Haloactinomyces albus]
MSTSEQIRPEITVLSEEHKHRARRQLLRRRPACGGCGGGDFQVGDALYLGFLFLHEDTDAYMVALTCTNPACPAAHTGITLRGSEFLTS